RRAVPRAGERGGPEEARGNAREAPAAHPRQGNGGAHLGDRLHQRARPADGRGRPDAHPHARVLGSLRRPSAQEMRSGAMPRMTRTLGIRALALPAGRASVGPAAAAPEGQMVWAVHISLAPVYFEPAEAPGLVTPFMLYYALHDALVKPMPGNTM